MLIIQQPSRLPQPSGLAAQQSMIAFFRNWRRNKSLLRSTSGPCYPYPRSHSTVMVVPSNRPLPADTKKKPQPRRRPPLNRAIPTIPESKSNESIMSHASRVSTAADPSATATSAVDCVVIENRSAVERLPPVHKREATTMRRAEVAKEKVSPRSPLLSVAHTMREKLSKLTRRKSPSGGVKGSQSFSGFRGAPPPPPPVDENSNRVIKSCSMEEATLIRDRPSTSKVVIPQLPDPLCSDEPSETFEPPSPLSTTLPPPPPATVKVSMKADVLTVMEVSAAPPRIEPIVEDVTVPEEEAEDACQQETSVTSTGQCTTTVIVTERPRELPVSVVYQQEPAEVKKEDNKENSWPEAKQVTTLIITTKKIEEIKPRVEEIRPRANSPEKSKSPERFVMTVKTPEEQRKHRAFVVGERPPEAVVEEEPVKKKEVRVEEASKIKREDSKSPERYVMTVKTPEAQRKHRTFVVGQRAEEAVPVVAVEEEVKEKKIEKTILKTDSREHSKSPERYILTVRTPETLRKHRVLTIREGPPSERKILRSRSEERPTFKIWSSLRKSLTLRRTQTFSNTDIGPTESQPRESRTTSEERKKREEDEKREKFVIITKTPQSLRRHHTFMVGERSRSPDVPWIEEGELTEPIATVGPVTNKAQKMREKRTRSEEPRSEKEESVGERFIMTARTPLTMRKYQTFVVESKQKETALPTSASADVVQSKKRGDELLRELDAIYPTSSHLDSREFSSSSSRELTQFPQEYPKRITNAEMYSLTSTTPQLRRREDVASPTLFVLNRRSERPLDEDKRLEAVRESSQSDKAELRSPSVDDLTSFEDEIPMDTSADERVRPVVAVLPLTSRPLPSPKTGRKKKKGSLSSRCGVQAQSQRGPDHRLLRGLRSAGRIFAPNFLNKKRAPPPSSVHSLPSSTYSRRAPLAQSESTVVANSPLIENLPIEAWNIPRPRCTPPRAYAALIREEVQDTNGNPQQEDGCPPVSSPQFLHRGLIDDEILDQPNLVGDSFSESSDRLSDRAMNNVEHQQRRADVAPTQRNPDYIRNDTLVDQGLAQVADIKNQLAHLQAIVNNHAANDSTSPDVAGLARENDSLRRQLLEKDLLIEQLRQQLALRPLLPVSL